MRRRSRAVMLSVGIMLLIAPGAWAQPMGAERLLPKTTKGVVLITNTQELAKHWDETQLGQLMNDPVMEPFAKDLRRQFQDRWAPVRDRLGLTLDDLKGVPGGELAVALVQPAKDKEAVALVVDVTGHLPQARAMLDKVAANMAKQKAKETRKTAEGTTLIVFDLPKTEEFPASQVVYFLSGNVLGAADHQEVIEGILKRKLGQATSSEDSLAELPAYQAVMKRCREHAGDAAPQIRWFIEPLGYVEAIRTATPEEKRRKGVTVLDVLRDQGFTAVQGVGGFVHLKMGDYECVHRTAVYAPKPYKPAPEPYKDKVSMDLFVLPNHQAFTPPPWVPNDVAAVTTFYWDVLKAFDNVGPTFDQVAGEGEKGVWADVLESLKTDPTGPQIDLRSELVAHLGQRVTMVTDYVLPITPTSERLLFAVETRDEAAVAAGIRKMFETDPTMKRRELDGVEIWETIEEPSHHAQPPDSLVVDLPSMTPKKEEAAPKARKRFVEAEEEEEKLLPHAAVAVARGQLLIASHYDFLVEVLKEAKTPDPLSGSPDFAQVDAAMKQLGAGDDCLRSFSRTDETYRPTYELIRMGKMPQSETMFGRVLNALLGPHKKGAVRKQKVDGSQMPDYQVVRRYLGPAGLLGTTKADGWFFVGFTLKK